MMHADRQFVGQTDRQYRQKDRQTGQIHGQIDIREIVDFQVDKKVKATTTQEGMIEK